MLTIQTFGIARKHHRPVARCGYSARCRNVETQQRRKQLFVSAAEEAHQVQERHGKHSWRAMLIDKLHAPRIQNTLTALLVLDVIVVMVELFMEAEWPACKYIVRDSVSCCMADEGDATGSASGSASGLYSSGPHRFLSEGESLCEVGTEVTLSTGCDEDKYETIHTVHEVLFGISIAILGTFAGNSHQTQPPPPPSTPIDHRQHPSSQIHHRHPRLPAPTPVPSISKARLSSIRL